MKPGPVMPQIKTIVHLMLENRSLDTMLGWLYADSKPAYVYPEGSAAKFDGIPAGASNSYKGTAYHPTRGTRDYEDPWRVTSFDPYEPYKHVKIQMYGDDHGRVPKNPWSESPPMTGFAYDYHGFSTRHSTQEVMGAYSPAELPVLYGLAENFAVSDRWFASIPTQTDANRAFSVCGTSLGGVNNGKPKRYDTKTLFNALSAENSWGIYWQSDGIAAGDPDRRGKRTCYTADIFPQVKDALGSGEIKRYSDFLQTLENGGELPRFCYLEPCWGGGKGDLGSDSFTGIQGNDYHPPAWIGPAEADLNILYRALVNSKQWPNMLFIITFDEHGGTWDHVPPTTTVAPDHHTFEDFAFERLGVRVPTILVSPYVRPGTVFRAPAGQGYDYDHTSVIATVLKWAGIDPVGAGLGKRVAIAPTFEGALSGTPSTATPPSFEVPSDYASQGGGAGHLNLLDLNLRDVSVRDFRDACDSCDSVESFKVRLKELAARAARADD